MMSCTSLFASTFDMLFEDASMIFPRIGKIASTRPSLAAFREDRAELPSQMYSDASSVPASSQSTSFDGRDRPLICDFVRAASRRSFARTLALAASTTLRPMICTASLLARCPTHAASASVAASWMALRTAVPPNCSFVCDVKDGSETLTDRTSDRPSR